MARHRHMFYFLVVAALLACISALSVGVGDRFRALHTRHGSGTLEDMALGAVEGFKESIASLLWIKSEIYFHEYERRGGNWTEERDILPMVRLITLLDPHFHQAYSFGGYHLAKNLGKLREGLAFLREGAANNPDSFDIYLTLAVVLLQLEKDNLAAFEAASHAYQIAITAYRNDLRAELPQDILEERLVDIKNSMRLMGASAEREGDLAGALKIYQDLYSLAPEQLSVRAHIVEIRARMAHDRLPAP